MNMCTHEYVHKEAERGGLWTYSSSRCLCDSTMLAVGREGVQVRGVQQLLSPWQEITDRTQTPARRDVRCSHGVLPLTDQLPVNTAQRQSANIHQSERHCICTRKATRGKVRQCQTEPETPYRSQACNEKSGPTQTPKYF